MHEQDAFAKRPMSALGRKRTLGANVRYGWKADVSRRKIGMRNRRPGWPEPPIFARTIYGPLSESCLLESSANANTKIGNEEF